MKIELEVADIRNSQTQSEAYALLLRKKGSDDYLPVIIGLSEARAIVLEINKIPPRRPSTHDLFVQLTDVCNCNLQEVFIYKYEEGVFYANLILINELGEKIVLDARTSDAVTLALKLNKPIFIEEEIFLDHSFHIEPDNSTLSVDDDTADDDPEEEDQYIEQKIKEMSQAELEKLLAGAVESEEFELASKIHDEMERRKH